MASYFKNLRVASSVIASRTTTFAALRTHVSCAPRVVLTLDGAGAGSLDYRAFDRSVTAGGAARDELVRCS
jgi:hypothetical protein